jgi:hypothetical protein
VGLQPASFFAYPSFFLGFKTANIPLFYITDTHFYITDKQFYIKDTPFYITDKQFYITDTPFYITDKRFYIIDTHFYITDTPFYIKYKNRCFKSFLGFMNGVLFCKWI